MLLMVEVYNDGDISVTKLEALNVSDAQNEIVRIWDNPEIDDFDTFTNHMKECNEITIHIVEI